MDDRLQNATGQAIRFARERRAMRQADLSQTAQVSKAHLSRIETGRTSPSVVVLGRIAQGLGLTLNELTQEIEAERLRLSRRPAAD